MALDHLNSVYYNTVMNTESRVSRNNYTVSASTDYYDASAVAGGNVLKLRNLQYVTGGTVLSLKLVSEDELLMNREGSTQLGNCRLYATLGGDQVMFYPNPSVNDVIRTYFVPLPTALTDVTSSSPTAVPPQFHFNVLLSGLVADLLMKDQRIADSLKWMEKYEMELSKMKEWSASFGGDAPGVMLTNGGTLSSPYQDERNRYA